MTADILGKKYIARTNLDVIEAVDYVAESPKTITTVVNGVGGKVLKVTSTSQVFDTWEEARKCLWFHRYSRVKHHKERLAGEQLKLDAISAMQEGW